MKDALEKHQWEEFFDRLSQTSNPKLVRVEVLGEDLGDQVEEDWCALEGITYDPKDEELDIFTEEADHRIDRPISIVIQGDKTDPQAIEVTDESNQKQIISFKKAA